MYFRNRFLCETLNRYPQIIIYGTGDFAHIIYPQLVKYGLKEKIVCFTHTQDRDEGDSIDGIPVISIDKLNYDKSECVVLVAVSVLYHEEIKRTLQEYRYRHIVSLITYQIDYRKLTEEYCYLTSFEEYCGYIADWYVKVHEEGKENEEILQAFLDKGQYIGREKNSHLIIMICGHLSARTVKIASSLKRKGYEIIMLSYFFGVNPWCLDELEKLNIQMYQCQNITEMLYYALQYCPLVYFFEPNWGDCLWADIMIQNKRYFGKIVLALYDVLNDGYIGQKEQDLLTEKYSLEHADGIVWRWFSKEYLEMKKGFIYQGKSLQFLDYCSHGDIDDISYEQDEDILKLCMVVGYGDEIIDERIYETSYIEWARMNEILEKIGNREDCIFHFYAGNLNDRNIVKCQEYERQYKNFNFFIATEHGELIRRLMEYDFGCDLYTDGQELADDAPMGEYYGSSYRTSIRNSYFDFLDAGLSIVTTNAAKMWEYLAEYDIVVKMNLSNLDIEYLKQHKQYYKKQAREARKELDIDNHIMELVHFFESIQNDGEQIE